MEYSSQVCVCQPRELVPLYHKNVVAPARREKKNSCNGRALMSCQRFARLVETWDGSCNILVFFFSFFGT